MAFNPDDKIQWENLAPTLQALLERKMEEHSRNYFNSHINKYVNIAISSSNSYTDSKVSYLQSLIESNSRAISTLSGKITSMGSGGGGGTGSGGGGGNPPPPSGGGGNPPPPSGGGGTGSGGGNITQEKKTSINISFGVSPVLWLAGGRDPSFYRSNPNVDAKVIETIYTYTTGSYGKTLIGQSSNTISSASLSLGTTIESHNGPQACINATRAYIRQHINDFKSRIAHGTEATSATINGQSYD